MILDYRFRILDLNPKSKIINLKSKEGQVAKWPTAADCKSALLRVRWFESILAHDANYQRAIGNFSSLPANCLLRCKLTCGSSSVGRATAFQAVGRGFEPRLPLNTESSVSKSLGHYLE